MLNAAGQMTGIITITDVLRAFVDIMGMKEGGTRLTLDMPDTPGSLARAAQAAQPSNIISVATFGHSEGTQPRRRFVMRVTGDGARETGDGDEGRQHREVLAGL